MRATTLLVAVLAAALLASTVYSAVCVAPASTRRYYTLSATVNNCTDVKSCRQALCECNGQASSCTALSFNESMCVASYGCLRSYIICINSAAGNASAASGATCSTWGSSITNLRTSFAAGTDTNWLGQDIYKACAYETCRLTDNVNCSDASSFICQRPAGAPTATNAPPLSSIPTVAPDTVKANITVTAAFPGNFATLFAPGKEVELEQFCNTTSQAVAAKLGIPAGAYIGICREGSLVVDIVVQTAATDTTVQDTIINNAANLNEDPDTTWIDDLQTAAATICSSCGISMSAPIVATAVIVEETPEPAPNTEVEQTCGSGCIAGVIVGVAVLVIVVVSVVKIVVKKISKGTEKTPASHEPTSGV